MVPGSKNVFFYGIATFGSRLFTKSVGVPTTFEKNTEIRFKGRFGIFFRKILVYS